MFGKGMGTGGCRRCSRCSIHYPAQPAFVNCQVCEEPTSYFNNVEPDPEWRESVEYAKMNPQPRASADPHTHRFERYLEMGFNEHQAQALANATFGRDEMPLYWGQVKKSLDSGADPLLVFDLYT